MCEIGEPFDIFDFAEEVWALDTDTRQIVWNFGGLRIDRDDLDALVETDDETSDDEDLGTLLTDDDTAEGDGKDASGDLDEADADEPDTPNQQAT